ncbi:MAG: N-acetylglucosamine-6-phosphate deacetylase [Mycobacteriales bacterium]|nr:N-acetylglucosamine-6-phosphate deacetylase [Mycobacteriales bacterium]
MLALRGGRVLTADGWSDADLLVDGDRIAGPDAGPDAGRDPVEVLDVTGCVVAPGLVDLHVHAAGGAPCQGPRADLPAVSRALARGGVTAYLATAFAAPLPELRALVTAPRPSEGARCVGVHLEGPWLSPAAAGAQPPEALRVPDVAEALALLDAGDVRCVTVAPELPGALDLVRALADRGVRVSLGHSTATYAEGVAAVRAGATGVTHCFNALSPLTGREPGLVGLALTEPDLVVEVIADGVHVHPASVRALVAARGPQGVALVSDCVDGCAPEGLVRDGDVLRLADGTLAGSGLSLSDAVRHVVSWGVPLADALAMASTTPARALGLDVALRPGAVADVVVLDADLRVRRVLVAGVLQ